MIGKGPALFGYRAANTPIHRVPASWKLAALAVAGFCAFASHPAFPLAAGAILVVSALLAEVPVASHRRNLGIVAGYAALIAVFRFVGPIPDQDALIEGLTETGIYVSRLAIALLAGTVFYETTSSLDVRNALYGIQRLFARATRRLPFLRRRGADKPAIDLALLFSLTISFIPRVFETWDRLNRSWDARGGKTRRGVRGALSRVSTLIPILIINLLGVAAVTERAIRNRSPDRKNSR
jgi:biotin transport system permease protein/energy-coupling factor transport system permease protein